MSSKLLTTGANFYPFDNDTTRGWRAVDNSYLTDNSDSTYWQLVSLDATSVEGGVVFAEDLSAQIPYNAIVNSVTLTVRMLQAVDLPGLPVTYVFYERKIGDPASAGGLGFSLPTGVITERSDTFVLEPNLINPITVEDIYNLLKFGIRVGTFGAFQPVSGADLRWIKAQLLVNFTLPEPLVALGSVQKARSTSAVLVGSVTPNRTFNRVGTDGYPGLLSVEWGPTTAYGNTQVVGIYSGFPTITLPTTLTGLTPSTLYHVRFVATDGDGTYNGDDFTFTTELSDPILGSS